MAKERNRYGEKQQIILLDGEIKNAIKEYLAKDSDEVPFLYQFNGYLFSGTKQHFTKMGFELEWHSMLNKDEKSYWLFILANEIAKTIK